MPNAGDSSKNVYGWSLMQIMVTPTKISAKEYQPNDYTYAGAMFALHSLYSYNAKKKYSFQTEFLAGVRGDLHLLESRYKEDFTGLSIIKSPWGLLININFTAEKQFVSVGDFMEINGGTLVRAGSFMDGFFMYPMIRIGQMSPYFDGYLNQFGSFEEKENV